MAINRLNRDDILNNALDDMDSSVLNEKDRPNGIIVANALSIKWLQQALDRFHKKFPFAADIKSVTLNILENDNTFVLPGDYILDYKDGVLLDDDEGRLRRRTLSFILNQTQGTTASPHRSVPKIYAPRGGTLVADFYPRADKAYTATFHYYALPSVLVDNTVPSFPDDAILVEYVWLKAREWHRAAPPGTALQFANQQIADLQKSGIGIEAEEDEIPLGEQFGNRFTEDPFVKVTN